MDGGEYSHGKKWMEKLKYDPIKPLMESENDAVLYYTKRDLLGLDVDNIQKIWSLKEVQKIIKKQKPGGFWDPPKKHPESGEKYALTETWRQMRFLVQAYEMTREQNAIEKACEYIFSCQAPEGDIRGILANQYAPYYTGAILYLLIKAGYESDPRVEKGIQWLLSMRQSDGGWVMGSPGMVNRSWKDMTKLTSTWSAEPEKEFDWSRPFSAAGTGMALRALAVHPGYRDTIEAKQAAALLKSKFLKKDNWSWYEHPDNWVRFQFPYWWNHLVSALDMMSLLGFSKYDADIHLALTWFYDHQESDGLWKVSYSSIHKLNESERSRETQLWITLSICRILKRFL
jgi:hypothetical protein